MCDLHQHVREMKVMADILVPHTFPLVDFEEERDVLPFKQRTIVVDGYDVLISLNKSDYKHYHSISLQIQSVYSPFLPFNLVCKLAQAFLGKIHVSYVEFFKSGKKLYCWTVRVKFSGEVLPPAKDAEPSNYEGFEYSVLNPK